jgi:hypothetical protein
MTSRQTRLLILVTIAGQSLSVIWGAQPVFYAHCHEQESTGEGDCATTCQSESCCALLGECGVARERCSEPDGAHRCHVHHFHVREDTNRFERGRLDEMTRKQEASAAAVPGFANDASARPLERLAPRPDATAAAPPPQRLLAIHSVRLLV